MLVMEVFVPTGSARAFRMMPILVRLADRIGVTRQTMVLAYTFGDGFRHDVPDAADQPRLER